MGKSSHRWLRGLMVLMIFGLELPRLTTAATTEKPIYLENTVTYEEDFSTRSYLDYTEDAVWDKTEQEVRLSPADNVIQWWPTMTSAPDGGVYLVWSDQRTGSNDIYAQRFDALGFSVWPSEVRINRDEGLINQRYPEATSDNSGNLYVVWEDFRNNDSLKSDIYAQKLRADGTHDWPNDVRVNSDTGWTSQAYPDLAVDNSGNAVIIWSDYRNGASDIYAQKLDTSGALLWLSEIRVNQDTSTAYQSGEIALDGDGYAVIAWDDDRTGDDEIYAQRIDPSGIPMWAGDIQVNVDSTQCDRNFGSVITVDENKIFVVWDDKRTGYKQVYAQLLSSNGQREWVNDVRVNTDTGSASREVVATYDAHANLVLVWYNDQSYEYTSGLYGQKINQSGARLWLEDMLVRMPKPGSGTIPYNHAMVDNNGRIFVVWTDRRMSQWGSDDLLMQALDENGNWDWGGPRVVSPRTGGAAQTQPVVINDPTDNSYIVVWTDNRVEDTFNVYAQRFDALGNRFWTNEIRVNTSGRVYAGSATVAIDLARNAVVVWASGGGIKLQKIDPLGNKLWVTEVTLSDFPVLPPRLVVDSYDDIWVSWTDWVDSDHSDIYLWRVDSKGVPVWANPLLVNSIQGSSAYEAADIGIDFADNVIVVWEDSRNGDTDIYAQKLDTSGNKLWATDVQVNQDQDGSDQNEPSISVVGDGSMYVVWEDERSSRYDVYAQRLSNNGVRQWSDDLQVNGTTWEYRYNVNVEASTIDNAFIVWEENTDGLNKIMMQRINSIGNRLWISDLQVNLLGGTSDAMFHYRPEIVMLGEDAFVVWEDIRYGNPDVYGQLVSVTGDKLWSPDWRAISPDFFYFSPALIQSITVDTVTETIREATLTADMSLNGGGIQFSLTNDGGTTWTAVTPGVTHVFTTTGSDLRWRAELTGDPVWPRSPVVDSLRIEYSTQEPYADDYEPDDLCAQAMPLQVNGAVQAHTFHQYGDEDWAWFDVISGTTYILQTSGTQANADTELELRAACPQPPFADDDNTFGFDARVTWQATFSGSVYVKVTHHDPAVYGAETGYDLSIRTFAQTPVAVIVAGHDGSYSLQSNIDAMADQAYRTFLKSGVPKGNLRYFGPNPARDVDGNGLNDDIYATVTITAVRETVQDWAREQGVQLGVPFYIYLVDHGHYDQFLAAGSSQKIGAADLNLWLSNLEATSGADNINVILEACKSGSFIDVTALGPAEVSGHNRVVIASTSSTLDAYASTSGGYFSDAFWTAVGENHDLKTAFEAAKQAVQETPLSQQPWLDDNGDAVANAQDGLLALSRGLGDAFAGSPPVIDWAQVEEVSVPATLQTQVAILQAQVRDDFGVGLVWAEVYAPDFVEPEPSQDGTTPVLDVPTTTLTLVGSDLYSTTYPLTQTGSYRLVVYAMDDEGYRALPQVTGVCAGCAFVYLPLVLRGN